MAAESVAAELTTRDTWLAPMRALRRDIAAQASIAHIMMLEKEAATRLDQVIERARRHAGEQARTAETSARPPPRPIHTVQPAALAGAGYLESQSDIEEFLDKLRQALTDAIAEGKRVRIR